MFSRCDVRLYFTVGRDIGYYISLPYCSFATTVSQLKICDFFQEKSFKVLKCYNFL